MGLAQVIRDNRATVVCGALVALAIASACLFGATHRSKEDAPLVALVHDGDGQTHTLPLDTDARLTVHTSLGTNVLSVEDGSIRMVESDCPTGSCLRVQPLDGPGAQIICLPHKLWVEVVPQGDAGSTLDIGLAHPPDEGIDLQAR